MAAATVSFLTPATASSFQAYEASQDAFRRIRVIDFAEVTTAKGSATSQNDTVDVMAINAGEKIVGLDARIVVAAAASTTMTVGDSTNSLSYFISSVALDGTANTLTVGGGTAFYTSGATISTIVGGAYYATADTIRLKLNSSSAATTGRVELTAYIVPIGKSATV